MDSNDHAPGPSSEDLLDQFREGLAAGPEELPGAEPVPPLAAEPVEPPTPQPVTDLPPDPWGTAPPTPATPPQPEPSAAHPAPVADSELPTEPSPAPAPDPPAPASIVRPATMTPSSYEDDEPWERPPWQESDNVPEQLDDSTGPPVVGTTGSTLLKKGAGVLIAVVIAAGVFYFFNRGPHIDNLVAGDCFQEPANTENVTNVDEVPCVETHDYEVFAVAEHPAASGVAYPGSFTLLDWSDIECFNAFEVYVGTSYDQSIYYYDIAIPTEESWDGGDRGSTCLLYESPDNGFTVSPSTGTARSTFR